MALRFDIKTNTEGATLVEFSLISALLFLITFSFVEFGYLFFQFNNAQKATQLGAREASTRFMISGVDDCWVVSAEPAGTDCSSISNGGAAAIVCNGASPGGCDAAGMARIVNEMQRAFPNLQASNVNITYSPTSLGYIGRGKPIPAVTVEVSNLSYNYIVIGGLVKSLPGSATLAGAVGITSATTTVIGEDIGDGAS